MFWKSRSGKARIGLLITLALLLMCAWGAVLNLTGDDAATATPRVHTQAATAAPVATSTKPAPTSTAAPTVERTRPPLSPEAQALQTAYAEEPEVRSMGLGRKQILWELDHIPSKEQPPFLTYDLMRLWVLYDGDRISHLELNPDAPFASVEVAMSEAEKYAPLDAQYIRTYRPNPVPQLVVNVYTSEYLAEVFEPELFGEDDPGTFIIVVGDYEGGLTRAVMALGNRP